MTVEICNIGCSIVSVKVPDRDGNSVDVALGYDTVPEYEANPSAFGAVTGQFAARIRRGPVSYTHLPGAFGGIKSRVGIPSASQSSVDQCSWR